MNHQGILVVVSGFSGAGKGTLLKELLKRYDNYALSISATTRAQMCIRDSAQIPSHLQIPSVLHGLLRSPPENRR